MSEAPLRIDWLTFWIVMAIAVFLIWSVAAVLGVFFWPAWVVPVVYLGVIVVGGVAISPGEPIRTRLTTPLVLGVMHWCWGIGFITSPRALAR